MFFFINDKPTFIEYFEKEFLFIKLLVNHVLLFFNYCSLDIFFSQEFLSILFFLKYSLTFGLAHGCYDIVNIFNLKLINKNGLLVINLRAIENIFYLFFTIKFNERKGTKKNTLTF